MMPSMNPVRPEPEPDLAPGLPRRALLAALCLLPVAAAAAGEAQGPSWGEHGMVLFGGRDGLFASHMPMFHRPHDVQAILRLRATDPARERELRAWLAQSPSLWTIVPAAFNLDDLAPGAARPLAHLDADVVRGHFERGGTTRARAVGFEVERVLVWRRLDPRAAPPALATYAIVGAAPEAGERFAVLEIGPRPAVDHIVALSASAALPFAVRVPRVAAEAAPAVFLEALAGAGVRVRETISLETADLR